MKSELSLSDTELDFLMSVAAVRARAALIFARTQKGQSAFLYHEELLKPTVDYVLSVIRKNYPDLRIPFHSRWGHFRVGGVDRVADFQKRIAGFDPLEQARCKLDLVISSVLLDAGAGAGWKYQEGAETFSRSEGLAVASYHMFLAGAMSGDRQSLRADREGLSRVTAQDVRRFFQVSASNPLQGAQGRADLLSNLGLALAQKEVFRDGRPGNLLDYLRAQYGDTFPATALLKAVLEGLGTIWPGRLSANGRNLGDVWQHSSLAPADSAAALVPFHKLSQWLTYSLIEPLEEAGLRVTGVEELTGLAEYRNGGLFLDSGLLSLKNPADSSRAWAPDSDLVIEWRALTVALLDLVGAQVQKALGKSPQDFPLAKVLEGGTWWAGRILAQEKRANGAPPLNIISDGTVF